MKNFLTKFFFFYFFSNYIWENQKSNFSVQTEKFSSFSKKIGKGRFFQFCSWNMNTINWKNRRWAWELAHIYFVKKGLFLGPFFIGDFFLPHAIFHWGTFSLTQVSKKCKKKCKKMCKKYVLHFFLHDFLPFVTKT